MSQYDHLTQTCTKKPLSQHWHRLGDGSGVVQRDIYSAFLARCVMNNAHHPSPIEALWAAQKPVLLHTGWLRHEPAKIEPSGKITLLAPSEPVVCNRRRALGHGQEVVAETQALGDPDGFAFRTPRLKPGGGLVISPLQADYLSMDVSDEIRPLQVIERRAA